MTVADEFGHARRAANWQYHAKRTVTAKGWAGERTVAKPSRAVADGAVALVQDFTTLQ